MSTSVIHIKKSSGVSGSISIPASKSESNRALIMNALMGNKSHIINLSESRDTKLLQEALDSPESMIDVKDAGTTMRFLTAYFAVRNQQKVLTGTERMEQRPIGILVESLQELGAVIQYQNKEGYPPISINGFTQMKSEIAIRGDVSSQFISALLMIAPTLPDGLTLELKGTLSSKPYILMTLRMMENFGIHYHWNRNIIKIAPQKYKQGSYVVDGDWSGASYWYALVALSNHSEIILKGLKDISIQGDIVIIEIMEKLGVKTRKAEDGLILVKQNSTDEFRWDFSGCPDLAQTVIVVCAANKINAKFTGLESLKIKETDRIKALQAELGKLGVKLIEGNNEWYLDHTDYLLPDPGRGLKFSTYDDHRMAMALAPMAMKTDILIENPEVVNKSYPQFWDHLKHAGIKLETSI